jgi:Tfp pilus assembly protein PilF
VATVYLQVRHFNFVFLDDHAYITENPAVQRGLTWETVKWAFTTTTAGNWHPVTWLSHLLDVESFGLRPGMHHLVNVAFHAANTLLVFALMIRLTDAIGRSALVAALFGIHPLHVESVAWISERKDVLSTFFLLLTLHAYVRYTRNKGRVRVGLVAVLYCLALMAKPMVITLPFVMLLLDYWPLRRVGEGASLWARWRHLIVEKLPLFAATAFVMVLTLRAPRSHGAVVSFVQLNLGSRVLNAIGSYGIYIRDTLWPARLAAYYPFHPPSVAVAIGILLALLSVTTVVFRLKDRYPVLVVGWLWYLGTLVPAIGLVQVGDQGRADRFTYVPTIGLFLAATWMAAEAARNFARSRIPSYSVAMVTIAALTVAARNQTAYWRDNLTLLAHTVAVTNENYRAESLLGVALSDAEHYEDAVQHFEASLRLVPDNAETRNNLASALDALGRTNEAADQLEKAVKLQPNSAVFNYNLGVVRSKQGRTREALDAIQKASGLDPSNKEYREAVALLTPKSR